MSNKKRTSPKHNYIYIFSIVVVVIIAATFGSIYIYDNSHKTSNINIVPSSSTQPVNSTANNLPSQGNKSTSTVTSTQGSSSNTASQKQATASQATLVAPTGTFVSNHNPGVGSPTQEESSCTTTPGATCVIEFTMGGTTKQLTTQTVGNSGTVYWSWDATTSGSGLTAGSWSVSATSTLNGKSLTSNDVIPLVIQS